MLDIPLHWQADALQSNFKSLLNAMSQPGSIQPILLCSHSTELTNAVLATLLDASVSFADPDSLLSDETRQFSQAKQVVPERADYVIGLANQPPSFSPKLGTLNSPEQSATLFLRVDSLQRGDITGQLTGPGIKRQQPCCLGGVHRQWLEFRQQWNREFPMGVDMFFIDSYGVMAWPRTSRWQFC